MGRKITIKLDRTREMRFSWEAIYYLLDKYESMAAPLGLVTEMTDGSMLNMTKDRLEAFFDLITALFIADDPDITPKKVMELMPYDRMNEMLIAAAKAISAGKVQDEPGNPQTPAE